MHSTTPEALVRFASLRAGVVAALRRQVERWNANAGGEWRTEEIDLVTAYLNERYYTFPCPPSICREPARAQARPTGS